MFTVLLVKEIHNALDFRFFIATVLCLILLPLGVFVATKSYEQRLADYRDAQRLYLERSQGNLSREFQAEGFRPPSPLSFFALGLEPYMPNKVQTSNSGTLQMTNETGVVNPQALLSGRIDFMFITGFILSLLALVFTFNSVCGEKELGSLRQVMANAVPRWTVLLAKVLGNYLVFMVPFLVGFLLSILIVNLSGSVPVFSIRIFPLILFNMVISLIFLFDMFVLGVLFSALNQRSIMSMIVLLFIWVILVLVIPKISPMLAQVIHPLRSPQVVAIEKKNESQELEKEMDHTIRKLFDETLKTFNVDFDELTHRTTERGRMAKESYLQQKSSIESEYKIRIANSLSKIDRDYRNTQDVQSTIAMNFARFSPVSCYTYLIAEFSGTGVLEMRNFNQTAVRFQEQVQQEVYNNYDIQRFGGTSGGNVIYEGWTKGFDPKTHGVPSLVDYRFPTLDKVFRNGLLDMALLGLFGVVFFGLSFVAFARYDLR